MDIPQNKKIYIRRDVCTVKHMLTFERGCEGRIISSVNFASKNYMLSDNVRE
jgi:hypothetical protein